MDVTAEIITRLDKKLPSVEVNLPKGDAKSDAPVAGSSAKPQAPAAAAAKPQSGVPAKK
jgi:hypothetical protein